MAKKKFIKLTSFMKKISNTQNIQSKSNDKVINTKEFRFLPNKLNYTNQELNDIFRSIFIPSETTKVINKERKLDISHITNTYFKSLYKRIITNKKNYDQITKLEPKLEQAETIIIPSILSPNSLKEYEFKLIFNDSVSNLLSENVQNIILEYLSDYFNNKIKLKDKLPQWLKDSIFVYGSKPVMILPPYLINNIRNQSISFESLNEFFEVNSRNLVISTESVFNELDTINKSEVIGTVESLIEDINKNILPDLEMDTEKIKLDKISHKLTATIESLYKEIKNQSFNYIDISDNINELSKAQTINKLTDETIYQKYLNFFGVEDNNKNQKSKDKQSDVKTITFSTDTVLNLGDFIENHAKDGDTLLHPMLLELPPECVIPIHVKNDPSQHLCYIIVLDEDGQPISIQDDDEYINDLNNFKLYGSLSNNLISKINNTFSDKSYGNIREFQKLFYNNKVIIKTLNKTYELFLDKIISSSIKNLGFTSVDFDLKSSIVTNLFYRLLRHKKTKFLIVPSFMMMYLVFKYNSDGTGISKVEELSFALSLKITYLVTKIFKLIDQAVDVTEIKLSLDENIANPVEFLYKLKSLLIANRAVDLTYDPIRIIKSLLDRQYSFVIDNIPGVKQFNIEKSVTNSSKSTNYPDDTLIQTIDDIITILLEVPPSAFNELSENEYARSLTTINLLFSLKMYNKRKILIKHLNKLIKNYLLFDTKLQDEIQSILSNKLKDEKISQKKIKDLCLHLIDNISVFIPEPRIVFDKTEFEQASDYIKFIDDIVERIFNPELISDRDLQDVMKTFSSHVKNKLYKKMLSRTDLIIGLDEVLKDFEELNIVDILETEQIVSNYKKALDDYHKKISGNKEENEGNKW